MYGPLIVRQTHAENIHADLYDEDLSEHVLMVQDWVHKTGVDMFVPHHWDDGSNKATSFLINGKGRHKNFGVNHYPGLFTPVEELFVKQGKRYRLRVISVGVSLCPVEMSIEVSYHISFQKCTTHNKEILYFIIVFFSYNQNIHYSYLNEAMLEYP